MVFFIIHFTFVSKKPAKIHRGGRKNISKESSSNNTF